MMTREQFLLIKIAEECVEISQQALKSAQFGLSNVKPGQDIPLDNGTRLMMECADLAAVSEVFAYETGLGPDGETRFDEWISIKKEKLEKYYQYSKSLGLVE